MCEECKKAGPTYVCTIGKKADLCNDCYAKRLRTELSTKGYTKSKIEQRMNLLLTNPDELEQWKGVCGFAACVHEILRRKPQAMDLFHAAFHDLEPKDYDADFSLADSGKCKIPFIELIGRPDTAASGLATDYFVDWILCRALMYVLKATDGGRYSREADFSSLFNIKDWNEVGHFALQTDGVAFVARNILGMKVLWVLKHEYAPTVKATREYRKGTGELADWSAKRLEQQTASLERNVTSVKGRVKDEARTASEAGLHLAREAEFLLDGSVAMFTGLHAGHIYTGWSDAKTPSSTFTANASKGALTPIDNPAALPINHWVVINKAELSGDKQTLKVSMWTWHMRREISYPVNYVTNYLREAVFVKL
jgi:hypothetical protein